VGVGFGDALVDDRGNLCRDVPVVERAVDHGPQLTTLGLVKSQYLLEKCLVNHPSTIPGEVVRPRLGPAAPSRYALLGAYLSPSGPAGVHPGWVGLVETSLGMLGQNCPLVAGLSRRGSGAVGWVLSVDFGTTNTGAAIRLADGRVEKVKLDPSSAKAFINDIDMVLSSKEYSLLQQFVFNPNKILSQEYLFEKVWGCEIGNNAHTLRKALSRLRGKLKTSEYTITSVRNEGYSFELV